MRTVALLELAMVLVHIVDVDVGNFSEAVTGTPGFAPVSEAVQAVELVPP